MLLIQNWLKIQIRLEDTNFEVNPFFNVSFKDNTSLTYHLVRQLKIGIVQNNQIDFSSLTFNTVANSPISLTKS